jgi:hypothetical protein
MSQKDHYSERRYAERRYAERRYAERRYAECRGAPKIYVALGSDVSPVNIILFVENLKVWAPLGL